MACLSRARACGDAGLFAGPLLPSTKQSHFHKDIVRTGTHCIVLLSHAGCSKNETLLESKFILASVIDMHFTALQVQGRIRHRRYFFTSVRRKGQTVHHSSG